MRLQLTVYTHLATSTPIDPLPVIQWVVFVRLGRFTQAHYRILICSNKLKPSRTLLTFNRCTTRKFDLLDSVTGETHFLFPALGNILSMNDDQKNETVLLLRAS